VQNKQNKNQTKGGIKKKKLKSVPTKHNKIENTHKKPNATKKSSKFVKPRKSPKSPKFQINQKSKATIHATIKPLSENTINQNTPYKTNITKLLNSKQ